MDLRLYLFRLWNMFCFIVEPPLDVKFEMDLEADVAIWRSDIDSVMLEDWLQDFEGRSWQLVLLGNAVGLTFEAWLCIQDLVGIFYIIDLYSVISVNVMTLGRYCDCN